MFTGLVEEVAEVARVESAGEGKRIELEKPDLFDDVSVGDSVSVSGACLTVEGFNREKVRIFLSRETLDRTWFSEMSKGDELNLERSLTPEDRMGGHYVQGHVDNVAEVLEIRELEEGWDFRFSLPGNVSDFIVEKGFVAVEGISLTVSDLGEDWFEVTIIPETWESTNLSDKERGERVNIEADVMAKYASKDSEGKS